MSSSRKPVNLFLVSLTPAIWAQFYSWYDTRGTDRGHYPTCTPNIGVWVVREAPEGWHGKVNGIPLPEGTPQLIAGCAIFPTDGPYAQLEWVNTNPEAPPILRKSAVEIICWQVRNYCVMTGKKPIGFPMHKSIIKMMEKVGFQHVKPSVKTMWAPSFVPVGTFPGEKTELTSAAATMDSADAAE